MSGFQAVALFLVSLVFTVIIFSLWLRMALRFFKISAVNPLSQIIYSLTNPVLLPLHRWFKISYKPSNAYDWMAFIVLTLTELVKIIILSLITLGALMPITFILVYVIADLIVQPCDLIFYLILIEVILSWVSPGLQHPMLQAVKKINAPFLNFGRLIIPDISGFDFSPFVILILLKIITLFVRHSLPLPLL